MGISHYRLSMKAQIAIIGKLANVRQPDLIVLSEEVAISLGGTSQRLINHDIPPSALVVEVVSPQQEERDYRHKHTEYVRQCIPE